MHMNSFLYPTENETTQTGSTCRRNIRRKKISISYSLLMYVNVNIVDVPLREADLLCHKYDDIIVSIRFCLFYFRIPFCSARIRAPIFEDGITDYMAHSRNMRINSFGRSCIYIYISVSDSSKDKWDNVWARKGIYQKTLVSRARKACEG